MDDCLLCTGCLESIRGPCDYRPASNMQLFRRMIESRDKENKTILMNELIARNKISRRLVESVYNELTFRDSIEKQWTDYVDALEYFYKKSTGIESVNRGKIMIDYLRIKADNKLGG